MTDIDTLRLERRVLLLMALVQFINIWDFMIVMPLGPDWSAALGVNAGHIGWVTGSYSVSAAITGLITARYLDRFDRRNVLLFTLTGLMVTTLSMTLAKNLPELIATRIITGMFGGPVIACSLAVIADIFPEHRRGEAMGKVFGSFSIAAMLGVPLGLELAHFFGWQSPFIVISAMALLAVVTIRISLPPMRHHLEPHITTEKLPLFASLRRNPAVIPTCVMISISMFAVFMVIPNVSAHVQQNLGYPREWLGLLYGVGGVGGFFAMRIAGKQSDRSGYAKTCLYATIGLWLTLWVGFYIQSRAVPVLAIFVLFMITMSVRNVTSNALISKIPEPQERAGFMSLISALQHLMCGAGAMFSTLLLTETPDHRLAGMETVTLIAMAGMAVMPWMMFRIERIMASKAGQP